MAPPTIQILRAHFGKRFVSFDVSTFSITILYASFAYCHSVYAVLCNLYFFWGFYFRRKTRLWLSLSLSISLFFSHSLSHFVCNWFQVPEHIVASNCEIFSRMDKRRWFKPKGAHLNIVWMGETLDRPWPRHCMAYAQMVNREMFKRIESRSQPNAIVIVIEPFNVWTRAVSSLTSVIHLFFCHTQFHFERPASILCMCKRAIFPFSFFHFSFNLTIAFWLEPYRLHCTNTPA